LGEEPEILDLMGMCNFDAVFLGIETPDEDSLRRSGKTQNLRRPLEQVVDRFIRAGLRPIGGFMMGFDGEQSGAGARISELVERAAVPEVCLNLVQALPNTKLWHRLESEGRLRTAGRADKNQTSLMNFTPTRPIEEIASEFTAAFWALYDPCAYLDRTCRCFCKLGAPRFRAPFHLPAWTDLRAFLTLLWRQGIKRTSRWGFWHHLVKILRENPGVWQHYLEVCAHNEHFLEYRQIVRDEIARQVGEVLSAAPRGADPMLGRDTPRP
jgi:hypothetical protein